MKIRRRTLWRVPVYCVIASVLSYYLTVALGFLYIDTDTSIGAEGSIEAVINPVKSAVLNGSLFLAVLLLGGFWFFRSMTKKEIAVSAAILSAIYLVLFIWELWFATPFPVWMAMIQMQDWISHLGSLLATLICPCFPYALLSCFTPFLFVPFGRCMKEGIV